MIGMWLPSWRFARYDRVAVSVQVAKWARIPTGGSTLARELDNVKGYRYVWENDGQAFMKRQTRTLFASAGG
jgi:hypothetical protein